MPSNLNYLAIDLGAESGRAMVGEFDGERLRLSEAYRFANVPAHLPDGLHWDVLRLWTDIKQGLALAARRAPLASMGLDAWGVDFGLLDRRGALLENPYHYRDARTDGMVEAAFRQMPRSEIFELTGIQFMPINTLYQLFSMAGTQASALDIAETLLMMPDLFNYWLTGKKAVEFTIATTSQCYNPRQSAWADLLLAALGIPRRIFPDVVPPGSVLGTLLPHVAEETGAGALPVIAPASHDTGSAVAAVPAEGQDFAWLSSGTWSIMGAEVRQPNLTPQALAYNFTNEGGVLGSWRLSKNIAGLWLVQECKREWNLSYDEITYLAAEARPFVATIDPDSERFLHPGQMPEKIRDFCAQSGQMAPQTQGEIVRVALESLALKYCLTLKQLEELTGKRLEPLHIIGGGAKNRLLNQLTADCTGRQVVAGPVEATAIGNILMQAMALGQLDSLTEARRLVRQSFEVEAYQPASAAGWEAGFEKLLSFTNPNRA